MDDKEIFRTHYFNIKALVNISGRHLKKETYLLRKLDLNELQLRRLNEILDNEKHPWMIDYYNRSSFVKTGLEASQAKGPSDLILKILSFIFLLLIVVGICIGAEWTLVDIAKFIFGLGTAVGVILLIRKLPIYFYYITILIGYAILIMEYPDLDIFIIIAPPVAFWALGDLLLSVFI